MESKSECLSDDSPSGPGSALALAFDLGLVDPLVPFDSLDFFLRDFFAGSGMPGLAESDGSCCCWWRLAFTLPSDESLEWFLLCFTFVGSLFLGEFSPLPPSPNWLRLDDLGTSGRSLVDSSLLLLLLVFASVRQMVCVCMRYLG